MGAAKGTKPLSMVESPIGTIVVSAFASVYNIIISYRIPVRVCSSHKFVHASLDNERILMRRLDKKNYSLRYAIFY